jgi:predicted anti-sigma-YlaC factor YlaD
MNANCLEFKERLQQHLDRQPIELSGELEQHVATCPECRQWQQAALRLEEGLRQLPPPLPPAGLADRIVAQALADRQATLRFRRRALMVAALAASVLLMALAGYSTWRPFAKETEPSPAPQPFVHKPPPPEPPPDNTPPSLGASVTEASDAVAALARRTADETVEPTRLLWSVVAAPPLSTPAQLPPPFDPTVRSLRDAGQGLSSGLEPVAKSARRAFGLFLREIPNMGVDAKSGL